MRSSLALAVSLSLLASMPAAAQDKQLQKWAKELSSSKPDKRLKAIAELGRIGASAAPTLMAALDDADERVRTEARRAMERLGEPAIVHALKAGGPGQRAALALLKGPVPLAEVARTGPAELRKDAVKAIRDPDTLAGLARTGPDEIRAAAIDALADPALLGSLAKEGPPEARPVAAAKLIALARSGESAKLRLDAVRLIDDQPALVDLARADDAAVRREAVARLADPALLRDLARTAPHEDVRGAAALKAKDQALLTELARKDPSAAIRQLAVRGVDSQVVLGEIARKDASAGVRLRAVLRLTSAVALRQIALKDASPEVRATAAFLAKPTTRRPVAVVIAEAPAAVDTPEGKKSYLDPVVEWLRTSFTGRGSVLLCPAKADCSAFPAKVVVNVQVKDNDQCFSKFYFGSGPCGNPGKDVSAGLVFQKEDATLKEDAVAGRTPESVAYKVMGYRIGGGPPVGGVDLGPNAKDVHASTLKSWQAALTSAKAKLQDPALAGLFEP